MQGRRVGAGLERRLMPFVFMSLLWLGSGAELLNAAGYVWCTYYFMELGSQYGWAIQAETLFKCLQSAVLSSSFGPVKELTDHIHIDQEMIQVGRLSAIINYQGVLVQSHNA